MATIAKVVTKLGSYPETAYMVVWEALTTTNADGAPAELVAYSDRSVQVVGTFDGASLQLQGSNDGINYKVLTDPQGNALTFTATNIESIAELTRYIRPAITVNGAGSVDLDVYVLASGVRTGG